MSTFEGFYTNNFSEYRWLHPEKYERWETAKRIHTRYIRQEGGIPYALRFKGWCKRWGIVL